MQTENFSLIQIDGTLKTIELSDVAEGSIIKFTYKSKDSDPAIEDLCARDIIQIKILAKTGFLVAVSNHRDIESFEKWCTIADLNRNIAIVSKPFSYALIKTAEII